MAKHQVFIVELVTPEGGFIYNSDVSVALASHGHDVVVVIQVPGISAENVEFAALTHPMTRP